MESWEDPDLGATRNSDAVNPGKSRARWEATRGWGSSARSSDRRDHKGSKGHKGGGGAAAP